MGRRRARGGSKGERVDPAVARVASLWITAALSRPLVASGAPSNVSGVGASRGGTPIMRSIEKSMTNRANALLPPAVGSRAGGRASELSIAGRREIGSSPAFESQRGNHPEVRKQGTGGGRGCAGRTSRAGRLSSAALDVFETEPLDPRSLPTELKDVILAPHLGSYSVERVALPRQRWGELVLQAASGGLPSRRSSSTRISSTVVALPECARVTQY
jgi:hypothetical protein